MAAEPIVGLAKTLKDRARCRRSGLTQRVEYGGRQLIEQHGDADLKGARIAQRAGGRAQVVARGGAS
ncbi:hypothetical protein FPZ24_00015 [Sphingomonas panacisoli]|uniref:Uncharacterized protein n=1 Tax=Sphingomonas panacisoli TaxID=1813879 RepID=A0A5B8LDS6_9SPHN|nr:hypothetical protein [Sphingomonas panacisoli]QDZ06059.1 hypothetical protein FPZ24_00015 [Sphingomonas panacisoli]